MFDFQQIFELRQEYDNKSSRPKFTFGEYLSDLDPHFRCHNKDICLCGNDCHKMDWIDDMMSSYNFELYKLIYPGIYKTIAPALSTFYFVTINYKEGVPYSDQIKRAQNVFKKLKTVGYYTLEQRSTDIENIHGIHTHLILFSDKKPSKVHQYIYESVKSKVGNKKHVDVRRYNIDLLEDKLAYMRGDKWDDDKLQKVEVDKIWKQKNNIELIYTYGSQDFKEEQGCPTKII